MGLENPFRDLISRCLARCAQCRIARGATPRERRGTYVIDSGSTRTLCRPQAASVGPTARPRPCHCYAPCRFSTCAGRSEAPHGLTAFSRTRRSVNMAVCRTRRSCTPLCCRTGSLSNKRSVKRGILSNKRSVEHAVCRRNLHRHRGLGSIDRYPNPFKSV